MRNDSPVPASAEDWLREKAPELLQAEDEAQIAQIGQKFFKQYGQHFVVRSGKHRMKTFAAVVKDDPKFVERAVRQSNSNTGANKNIQLLAAFASQQSSQETADSFRGEAARSAEECQPCTKALRESERGAEAWDIYDTFLAFIVELARLLRAQWLDAEGFNVSEFLSPLVQKVPSVHYKYISQTLCQQHLCAIGRMLQYSVVTCYTVFHGSSTYLVRFSLTKLGCNTAADKAHACLSRR
ncbi:unnamed protein product [Symbiodinium necroappetens]|uniref:Uncharacterized protein n=1 Tax=Symbiodinium necroappetens TaxID=1628268 RepID=A0A812L2B0_9DINO|nr:unnamed protein product [Symbiodinium necroappetens]